jgi:hypothetical protein
MEGKAAGLSRYMSSLADLHRAHVIVNLCTPVHFVTVLLAPSIGDERDYLQRTFIYSSYSYLTCSVDACEK